MKSKLTDAAYINLMTFKRDGHGVATPVWFATIGERLYVFTDGTSFKVKRLRANARSRVAVCNAWGTVDGRWHEAEARVVDDAATIESAYTALRRKYGWQMWLVDLTSRLAGRIERRVIVEIALGKSDFRPPRPLQNAKC